MSINMIQAKLYRFLELDVNGTDRGFASMVNIPAAVSSIYFVCSIDIRLLIQRSISSIHSSAT
jgi:hypothetical protein